MARPRRSFFGNWRSKVVALFFAVSIWFVAYQSESRTYLTTLHVVFAPADTEHSVIMETRRFDEEKGIGERFDGTVHVQFSGPRKAIALLREGLERNHVVRVPRDRERHQFRPEDFGFPREGVTMTSIVPPVVIVAQEEIVEVVVQHLEETIQVEPSHPGYEVTRAVVKPESQSLRLRVPRSLQDQVSVRIPVVIPFDREEVEGLFEVRFLPDDDRLRGVMKVWDFDLGNWVALDDAPRVHARAALVASDENLDVEAVRVTFRLPVLKHAFRLKLLEATGDTIPVRFTGPKDRIEALQKKFREDPALAVSVPVPAGLDPDQGGVFTFTEDALELPRFPGVRIEQHPSRKKELKTAWSYEVKVFPEEGGEEARGGK